MWQEREVVVSECETIATFGQHPAPHVMMTTMMTMTMTTTRMMRTKNRRRVARNPRQKAARRMIRRKLERKMIPMTTIHRMTMINSFQ